MHSRTMLKEGAQCKRCRRQQTAGAQAVPSFSTLRVGVSCPHPSLGEQWGRGTPTRQ